MKKFIINCLFILTVFNGCKNPNKAHPEEIKALIKLKKNNGFEIEKILNNYSSVSDTLKLNAAYYLLLSLEKNHYIDNVLIDPYYEYIKMVKRDINKGPFILAALKNIYGPYSDNSDDIKYDLKEIKSSQIIENIDGAFTAWVNAPWRNSISFSTFCEYILPYRIYNEYPDYEYRSEIYKQFKPTLDSLQQNGSNILSTAKAISEKLKVKGFLMTNRLMFLPNIRVSKLMAYRGGTCWDMSDLTTYVMRAVGIPVTSDFVIQWPTRDGGHSWNVLIDEKGKMIPFSTFGQSFSIYSSKFLKKGKVYRNTTLPQKETLAMQKNINDVVPSFFLNTKIKDVTEQYVKCFDVSLNLKNLQSKYKYAYLCVFDDHNWIPIQWAKIRDGEVVFKKMEGDIVYMPGVFDNGTMIHAGNPVKVDANGHLTILNPKVSFLKREMSISKIHPLLPHYIKNTALTGGLFQGANDRTFSTPYMLYQIKTESEQGWNTINLNSDKMFKFIRYKANEVTEAQLGELEFYSDRKLDGLILESSNSKFPGSENTKDRAFDGNLLTYYQSRVPGSWIGIELKQPAKIRKIRFSPVVKFDSTANIIVGHIYKLSYLTKDGWLTFKTQMATKTYLNFMNTPSKALFRIDDMTTMQRVRIFTYENNKQVWR